MSEEFHSHVLDFEARNKHNNNQQTTNACPSDNENRTSLFILFDMTCHAYLKK